MSASESLVDQPKKNILNIETGAVKFVKDIESVDVPPTTKLIGLTKEQLEQYRNDPFWKPIRYGLFVLFWLIWLAMFVGAILIVVTSKQCLTHNATETSSVISQIFTPTFFDSDGDGVGDLNGIKRKLEDLRKVGFTAIWPTPLLKINKDNFLAAEVIDIMSFDERFLPKDNSNAINYFKNFIAETHKAGLQFIVDIPLTIFNDLNKTWVKNIPKAILTPLVALKNGNAVALDLNNDDVKLKLAESAAQFLRLGVDAIHLADYGLLRKTGKYNSKHIGSLIEKIHDQIVNDSLVTEKKPIILIEGNLPLNSLSNANLSETYQIIDLSFEKGNFFKNLEMTIQKSLKLNKDSKIKPVWQFSSIDTPRIDQQFVSMNKLKAKKSKITTLLTLIQLFLPGPVSIYYGQEIGLTSPLNLKSEFFNQTPMRWNFSKNYGFSNVDGQLFFPISEDSEELIIDFETQYKNSKSPLRIFKRMSELRFRDSVFKNEIKCFKVNNLQVFMRYSQEKNVISNIYVLVINLPFDGVEKSEPFQLTQEILQVRRISKAEVKISFNSDYQNNEIIDLSENNIMLGPFQALVLRLL